MSIKVVPSETDRGLNANVVLKANGIATAGRVINNMKVKALVSNPKGLNFKELLDKLWATHVSGQCECNEEKQIECKFAQCLDVLVCPKGIHSNGELLSVPEARAWCLKTCCMIAPQVKEEETHNQ